MPRSDRADPVAGSNRTAVAEAAPLSPPPNRRTVPLGNVVLVCPRTTVGAVVALCWEVAVGASATAQSRTTPKATVNRLLVASINLVRLISCTPIVLNRLQPRVATLQRGRRIPCPRLFSTSPWSDRRTSRQA